jgi:hypothetical protein
VIHTVIQVVGCALLVAFAVFAIAANSGRRK